MKDINAIKGAGRKLAVNENMYSSTPVIKIVRLGTLKLTSMYS